MPESLKTTACGRMTMFSYRRMHVLITPYNPR
jgi:hypothetical protein